MIARDGLEKERNNAKNAVEEHVYYFRHQLEGPYQMFLSADVRLAVANNTFWKYFQRNTFVILSQL